MLRYFKRAWDEDRGDRHASWGTSCWYLELDEDGWARRQIEVYEDGTVLKYSTTHDHDEYGGLADQALDLGELEGFEIPAPEFETTWVGTTARNERPS